MANGVMMQYFHWYNPADGLLWNEVRSRATELAAAGITGIWLPPAYKGTGGGYDVGYGVYDMYDLGEFDQKGSVRTKYGTREEYLAAVKVAAVRGNPGLRGRGAQSPNGRRCHGARESDSLRPGGPSAAEGRIP